MHPPELEQDISQFLDRGDYRAAATRVILAYGAEVLGFLVAVVGDVDEAADALAQASEDLWSGIRAFERRSSARTWFYTLARHAAARLRRSAKRIRGVPLSAAGALAAQVRTSTAPYLRTEVKDGFAAIRDALPPEDRALLVLRVDRGLEWTDIARVLAEDGDDGSELSLKRGAARLRKRFQLLKQEIRERARAAGLVADE